MDGGDSRQPARHQGAPAWLHCGRASEDKGLLGHELTTGCLRKGVSRAPRGGRWSLRGRGQQLPRGAGVYVGTCLVNSGDAASSADPALGGGSAVSVSARGFPASSPPIPRSAGTGVGCAPSPAPAAPFGASRAEAPFAPSRGRSAPSAHPAGRFVRFRGRSALSARAGGALGRSRRLLGARCFP